MRSWRTRTRTFKAAKAAPRRDRRVMIRGLQGPRGIFSAETVRQAIRRYRDIRRRSACWRWSRPPTKAVARAGSSRIGGGGEVAHEHGMKVHMDGARVVNAAVALGVQLQRRCRGVRHCHARFHQGLGAPLGAVLIGPKDFIGPGMALEAATGWIDAPGRDECRRLSIRFATQHCAPCRRSRQRSGPGKRNGSDPGDHGGSTGNRSGILDTSATGLTAAEFAARLRPLGVTISVSATYRARACTHLDISADQIAEALEIMKQVITGSATR